AAGIFPGLLLSAAFGAYILWRVRRSTGRGVWRPDLRELLTATREGIWSIIAPVVILGGIYTGMFSPTEAAGIACVYGIFVVWPIHREIGLRGIFESAARSMYLTAQIFVIVAAAAVYSWLLTTNGAPQTLATFITGLDVSP